MVAVLALSGCGSSEPPAGASGSSTGSSGTGGTSGGQAGGAGAKNVATGGSAHGGGAGASTSSGGAAGTVGAGGSAGSSGSGGNSGSSGSAGVGGSAGAGGSTAFTCSALCDDFETATAGGPPDAAKWTVSSPNCGGTGSLRIDDSVAHSGKRSVRIDGKGGYCNHVFFGNGQAIAALGKVVYARFFVRLGDALGQGHTSFLAMKDSADGGKDLRMGGQNGILMYNRESDDATLPALSPSGVALSKPLKTATWTCVEFRIGSDDGTIDTWVDGVEVSGLVADGMPTPDVDQAWLGQKAGWKPQLTDFRLGWESYAGQDMTLWVDDVALAQQRIGCT
jgi:hypothetical protein